MLNLYEKLVADGEPTVAQLITERRQENISLEFKTKANVGTGEPNRDDRRNLGIALSAFSNPMGGLIVWGVRTEKNADNVDCATEVRPIGGDRALQGGCNSPFSQTITPRHEGIFVGAISAGSPPDGGYQAIYVERSERRPTGATWRSNTSSASVTVRSQWSIKAVRRVYPITLIGRLS